MHFFGVFVCVYDYDSFAFVCPNYHCLFCCKLMIVLPLSVLTIIDFSAVSLLFMPFMMCACLLRFALFWLLELEICCIFLAMSVRYGSCSFGSSSFIAHSVSIIRLGFQWFFYTVL